MEDAFKILVDKLTHWYRIFVEHLPNALAALVVLVCFLLLYRLVKPYIRGFSHRVSSHSGVASIMTGVLSSLILIMGFVVVLSILQLEQTVASVLAGLGILGFALGFAFQDIAANFISGLILIIRRPFHDGQIVEISGVSGTVESIDLRVTTIRTFAGPIVLIPNKEVFSSKITNFSAVAFRRVEVPIGVSYSDDLEKAKALVIQTMEAIEGRATSEPAGMWFEGFGDSSINLTAFVWIDVAKGTPLLEVRDRMIIALKRAFDSEHISIPFPTQTLTVDRSQWPDQGLMGL